MVSTAPGTPDYSALLQQDPGFLALQQALSASDIQNASQRDAAIAQALIQFGMVPSFAQAGNQLGLTPDALAAIQAAITPQVQALAQQNTASGLSTEAELQQQEQQAMLGLRNSLAARGALSSGDDAYRTNLQQQAYARAQNQALQSLLGALGGYQQSYVTAHQAGQQQLADAIPGIVTNLVSLYPNGVPSTTGSTPTGTPQTAPSGGPVPDVSGTAHARYYNLLS